MPSKVSIRPDKPRGKEAAFIQRRQSQNGELALSYCVYYLLFNRLQYVFCLLKIILVLLAWDLYFGVYHDGRNPG